MDQLSALERELMRSVTALADGSSKELAALRASLMDYDASVTSGIEARLNEIEHAQQTLHQRMSALEAQHNEAWSKLTAILEDFTGRLRSYEASTNALSSALNKLDR